VWEDVPKLYDMYRSLHTTLARLAALAISLAPNFAAAPNLLHPHQDMPRRSELWGNSRPPHRGAHKRAVRCAKKKRNKKSR
jgi:hypothetical protein